MTMTRFAIGLALLLTACSPGPWSTQVSVDTGKLQGVAAGDTLSFKGIPFAAPPVGPLRWRAPQPAAAWSDVRKADAFGAICMQPERRATDTGTGVEPQSEDCLTLNVFRPADGRKNLPVMVWIHGGGLVNGSSSGTLYDGAPLARQGVVLVSINYRLGRFGYFAHPALTKEAADDGRLANYGLMDQVAALEWIKRNIAAFGGDPKNVTVFGESAGAASVLVLMVTPSAKDLFQAAVVESGYGRGQYPRLSTATVDGKTPAETEGVALMKDVGVETDDPAALRAVAAADIVAKSKFDLGTFGFITDGKVLPIDMFEGFRQGKEMPVPLVIGANSLETPIPPGGRAPAMEALMNTFVTLEERPALVPAYGDEATLLEHLPSDFSFTATMRSLAKFHMAQAPTYMYRFSAVSASVADKFKGAAHATERMYVFNTLSASNWATAERDQKLATAMSAYWVAFARTHNPNGDAQSAGVRAAWPRYDGIHIIDFTNDGPVPQEDPWNARLDALAKFTDPRS